MQYRKEIDGLRAIAVLPVILFHAGFSWFSGGYVGVDVFFVISGYLITSILIDDLEKDTFSIAKFYERRARRILPALFFVMLCCFPFAWLWMAPTQFEDFSKALIAISLISSNILFWKQSGYFEPDTDFNPLLHTWSLGVEEQFYLFFPLLLLLLWRLGHRPIFYTITVLSIVSLLTAEWGWRHAPSGTFYLLPTRAWELGTGALCALFLANRTLRPNTTLSLIGLLAILYSIFFYNKSVPFPSLYTLVPVGGTALIILYGSSSTLTTRLLSNNLLVSIGLISFSAYLWHQPLFAFSRIKGISSSDWPYMAGLSLLSLLLAYFSWKFIEAPFRRRGSLVSRKAIFAASAVASLAFITTGLYGDATDGLPARINLSPLQQSYLATAQASPYRKKCHSNKSHVIPPEQACQYNQENGSVAVFGDSHAVELAYAIADTLGAETGVRHFSFSDCAPTYLSNTDTPCSTWTRNTIDYISRQDDIKKVVVTYRIQAALWGDHQDTYPALPDSISPQEKYDRLHSLEATLDILSQAGKQVVYVAQSPELPFFMNQEVYHLDGSPRVIKGVSRSWWEHRTAYFRRHFSSPENVITIRPEAWLCDNDSCFAGKDGKSFYFDDDHLSLQGAHLVAQQVINSFQ
ncbi:MAG: acyltransferase [Halomonas sp.]|uniref:acyltransferase family protein n=1 Tax=Halomonas sp. TaxID=1486246 RepID=UPI0017A68934|nr:acyltransferase family protein [Halomonas sp.]NWN83733.1 acyltransferase [Halomonas sp.]